MPSAVAKFTVTACALALERLTVKVALAVVPLLPSVTRDVVDGERWLSCKLEGADVAGASLRTTDATLVGIGTEGRHWVTVGRRTCVYGRAIGLEAVGLGGTAVGAQGVEPGVGNAGLISRLVEGSGCVAVSDEVVALGDEGVGGCR